VEPFLIERILILKKQKRSVVEEVQLPLYAPTFYDDSPREVVKEVKDRGVLIIPI